MLHRREVRIAHPATVPRVASAPRRRRLLLLVAVAASAPIACPALALVLPLPPPVDRIAVIAAVAVGLGLSVLAGGRIARVAAALDRRCGAAYRELLRVGKPAALGDIAFGIVHDLNNPLAIINEEAGWMLDLLDRSPLDTESARTEIVQAARTITGQVTRSTEITGRILRWARAQGRGGDGPGVCLNDAIGRALALLDRELQATGVQVVKQLDSDLPAAAGDPREITQVFLHLIKNARDAMKGTGGLLTVSTQRAGETVRGLVSDTGPGIAPAVLERIFDPYVSTKSDGEGTGLGLAISSWIVGQAGGRIEVDSAVGTGATFCVVLPATVPRQRSGDSHAHRSGAAGR